MILAVAMTLKGELIMACLFLSMGTLLFHKKGFDFFSRKGIIPKITGLKLDSTR